MATKTVTVSKPFYRKGEVEYRSGGIGEVELCGNCDYYVSPGGLRRVTRRKGKCELVKGSIDPSYTCNLWTPEEGG